MKDISVVLVTYNSSWEKTKKTIESILRQEQVEFEIVISDDGSNETNYDKIEKFFYDKKFKDYVLVQNSGNVGTIKNCIRALENAKGKYIKAISPGDLLLKKDSLRVMYKALINSKRKWAFGQMICVSDSLKKEMECIAFHSGPQDIKPYEENDIELIKYNYICCADKINVTTILIEKEIWLLYLKKISNKLKYVEDYAFEMMIRDGIIPTYVPINVGIYEVGSGISTLNNNKWNRILLNERKIFYNEIFKIEKRKEDEEKIYLAEYREKWTGMKEDELWLTEEDYEKCCLEALHEIIQKSKTNDIWIYGAGIAGHIMLDCLIRNGIEPKGIIDINYQRIGNMGGYKVVGINDIENAKNAFLVVSLMRYRDIVVEYLKENSIDTDRYLYVYARSTIKIGL